MGDKKVDLTPIPNELTKLVSSQTFKSVFKSLVEVGMVIDEAESKATDLLNLAGGDMPLSEFFNLPPVDSLTVLLLITKFDAEVEEKLRVERIEIAKLGKQKSSKGGQAKSENYQPLRNKARELVTTRHYQSRRNAAQEIKQEILEESKRLGIGLSVNQAELTITGWLKDMGLPTKHTTSS